MNTKLIIGLSVAAVVIIGAGIFIRFQIKSGEYRERIRNLELLLSDIRTDNENIRKALKESEAREVAKDSSLRAAKADVSKYISREQLYKGKIKVDSLLLKKIEIEDAKNDSLSKHFSADDWDCYIAKQVGENCN